MLHISTCTCCAHTAECHEFVCVAVLSLLCALEGSLQILNVCKYIIHSYLRKHGPHCIQAA